MLSQTPFDPQGFLDLADSLVSAPSPNEAELRSAVSRSYYALFLKARENLASSDKITPSRSATDHRTVITALKSSGGKEGHVLDKLLTQRHRADYDLRFSATLGWASQIVQTARTIWPHV
jgi:uncharacterized protein (UPF0332 family)